MAYDPYPSVDPADESAIEPPVKTAASLNGRKPWPTKLPAGLRGWPALWLGVGLGGLITIIVPRLFQPPSNAPAKANLAAPPGQSVSIASVKSATLSETLSTQGTVDSSDWIAVFPQATGVQIKEIRVKEGDRVETGQVIAILDNSVQQDRLAQAESQIRSASAQVESAKAQFTAGEAQVRSAQAQVESAKTVIQQRQAKLEQQRHNLEKAGADLKRYEDLAKAGAISAKDLDSYRNLRDTAQDGVNVAQADLAQSKSDVIKAQSDVAKVESDREKIRADGVRASSDKQANIDNRNAISTQASQAQVVTAPTSGILSKKNPNDSGKVADAGSITGNTPIFYIQPDNALELQVKLPESSLAQIRAGATVKVTSDTDPGWNLQAQVREVNPVIDPQTRQATVKISLPSLDRLKPGMFLRAEITVKNTQSLVVPAKSVLPQANGKKIVYVLEGKNLVKAIPVEVGDSKNGLVAVRNGLKEGDRVVVAGAGYLKEGDQVSVVAEPAAMDKPLEKMTDKP